MFPKNTIPATVAKPPEKPSLQKKIDTTVLYMADTTDQQVENNYSRWQVKRAKICACTVVLTTLILVAGTLGAITIVLQAQQHSTDKAAPTHAVPKEPLHSGPNSPQRGPYPNPLIKIDNGGLWPAPKNPVTHTPDLVAVDGEGTVFMSSSPKLGNDGITIDSLSVPKNPVSQPPDLVAVDGEGTVFMSSSPKLGNDGITIDSLSVPKNPVSQPPDLVAVDGDGTVFLSSSPRPDSDGIIINSLPDEKPIFIADPFSSSSSSSSPSSSSYQGRTYISSSFPYNGYYARGGVGVPSSSNPSEISGDSDLEGSAESAAYEINDISVGPHNSLQQDINSDSGPGPDVSSVSDDYSMSYPYETEY
ncbi:uncharacterized protein LOC110981624 [Acanthaster planci]|uniref:Uncharacterized protein LOC110981624 n=1 Tax=Acanthaster planci TaxID=133434 RepID=A0A8B7YP38_ACAPL|nr:uncharacterized protein LOC110981624 [Acanthaster planci]